MKRNYGINIVFFGNVTNLLLSFVSGWNFGLISRLLYKIGFKIMLLPVRGANKLNHKVIPENQVITYESAWNYSKFFPAFLNFLKQLLSLRNFLKTASKTGKEATAFTQIDKIAGMNYSNKGTIIDWLLFGDRFESFTAIKNIDRFYSRAIKSSHGLLSEPANNAREIHPEMEREYKFIKNELKLGKKVFCYPGLENELKLILSSKDFLSYLYVSNLKFCIDIFHTFQRGSRDGRNPNPVVPKERWFEFLVMMQPKVIEIHFRLDKIEVNKIINGKATEVKVFEAMSYIYHNYKCDIIYELYPDLFSSVESSVKKLDLLHVNLVTAFLLLNYKQV